MAKVTSTKAKRESRGGLPFKIERPEGTGHLNVIVYGDTGTGKTHLCGTANECELTNPSLLVDFDKGTQTLQGLPIDSTKPKTWKQIQEIYDWFRHENDGRYRCVILDGVTELQKTLSLGEILGQIDEDDEGGYSNLGATPSPDRQDWGKTGEQMRKFIRAWRDLAYLDEVDRRVHVIMTMMEKSNEKKRVVHPSLSGQLGLECGAAVDILARLTRHNVTVTEEDEEGNEIEVEKIRRHLLLDQYTDEDNIKYMAKDRSSRLGRGMWDPTINKLLGLWHSREEEE